VTVAVAAISTVGVVWTPGGVNHRSAAWAVDAAPSGEVTVRIHTSDFTDATGLNKELNRRDARTVVMLQSAPGACKTSVPSDVNLEQGAGRLPWTFQDDKTKDITFVIHPDRLPTGDVALLVLARNRYTFVQASDGPRKAKVRPLTTAPHMVAALAVRHVPSCAPNLTYDGVVGAHGITSHD